MKDPQLRYFDDKYVNSRTNLHFNRDIKLIGLGLDYPIVTRMFQSLALKESKTLDLGCGDEPKTFLFAPNTAAYVFGFDVSLEGLRLCRERAAPHRSSFMAVLGNCKNLPFDDCSVDVVVCYKTLEYLFEPRIAIIEISRVLRPGGQVLLCTLNRKYVFRRLYRLFHKHHWKEEFLPEDPYFSLSQLQEWLGACGLIIEDSAYPFSFVSGAWDMWLLPRLVTWALRKKRTRLWLRLLGAFRLALLPISQIDRLFRMKKDSSVLIILGRKAGSQQLAAAF